MNKHIQKYIDIVKSEEFPVCKEQKLLIKHIENCFENESIYVDEKQLENYLDLQKYFDFELFPWEVFCFALHNCTYIAPDILRWPDLLILVGRGAGKNGYIAYEDFCLLTPVNGIKEYHIDICAMSEEQASTSFFDVYNVLDSHKAKMSKHFSWSKTEIKNLKTRSILKFRTSNAKTKDGGRPGKVDFDEYHAYEDYKLIKVFKTGLGKKEIPRTTVASTMGDVRDGPLDNLLADALQILNSQIPDNGLLPFICRLDDDKEVHDPNNWHKANPSLRYFPTLLRELHKEYNEWLRDHLGNADFMTKRMNRPAGGTDEPVTSWENIMATNKEVIDLSNNVAVFGLDYMKVNDFLSAGLLFEVDNVIYWITHSWVCESCRDLSRIRFPVKEAAQKGLLTIVPGVEIPPEYPAAWLQKMKEQYNIVGGALDNYRYTLLKNPLEEIGFDCDKKNGNNNLKLVRPSDLMQVAPSISSDFSNQRIIWGDNELMRWYTNNTKVVTDSKGNMLYEKIEPRSRKTDGFMAFAAAYTQKDLIKTKTPISMEQAKQVFQVYTY